MNLVLEIGTKNYADDLLIIKKSLSHMETLVGIYNACVMSEPSSKFGWTFFKLEFQTNLQNAIEEKFFDMIDKYRGNYPSEKFTKFITDYFNSKGCDLKIKINS